MPNSEIAILKSKYVFTSDTSNPSASAASTSQETLSYPYHNLTGYPQHIVKTIVEFIDFYKKNQYFHTLFNVFVKIRFLKKSPK